MIDEEMPCTSSTRILEILDPEANEVHKLYLNEEDFQRAQRDEYYLAQLLQHAKENGGACNSEEVQPVALDDDKSQVTGDGETVWTHDAVLCLLNSIESHYDDLNNAKKRKHVFNHISNDLLSHGFNYAETACKNKWRSLTRSYKNAKDQKTKTGRGPTRFDFYEKMNDILGDKPSSDCQHTLESSQSEIESSNVDDSSNQEGEMQIKPVLRKKKRENSVQMSLEQGRNKRHMERMEIERGKLELEARKVRALEALLKKKKENDDDDD